MKYPYGIWLGSFVIVAWTLYFFFTVPVLPILLGGVVALGGTAVHRLIKKSR